MCVELKNMKDENNNNAFNEINKIYRNIRYNGVAYNFILKLFVDNDNDKKYIYEQGDVSTNNKVSIYLDEKNNLVANIINSYSSFKVEVKNKNIEFYKLINLVFEYGDINKDSSFIRIIINNKIMANEFINKNINCESLYNNDISTIGSNLQHNQNGSFDLGLFAETTQTYNINEEKNFFKLGEDYINKTLQVYRFNKVNYINIKDLGIGSSSNVYGSESVFKTIVFGGIEFKNKKGFPAIIKFEPCK